MPMEIGRRDGILQYPSQEASLLLQGLVHDGNPTPPLGNLRSGGTLWVIGHASQVGDGVALAREIQGYFPQGLPRDTRVHLIVCNASDGGVHSVAQRVSDMLQVPTRGYERPVRLQHGFHEPSHHMQDVRYDNMFAQQAYRDSRSSYYVQEDWRTHQPFRPDVEMTDAPPLRSGGYGPSSSSGYRPAHGGYAPPPMGGGYAPPTGGGGYAPGPSNSSHSSRSRHRTHGHNSPYNVGSKKKRR